MTALEAVQAVQYVTIKEKRFALIDADEWEALIDSLEMLEDAQIFKEAYTELQAASGNREQAGWRRWQDVRDELT